MSRSLDAAEGGAVKEHGFGKRPISPPIPWPKDAEQFGATTSYKIWTSKLDQMVVIYVTEYNCGSLYLEKEDLESMLERMR